MNKLYNHIKKKFASDIKRAVDRRCTIRMSDVDGLEMILSYILDNQLNEKYRTDIRLVADYDIEFRE